MNECGSDYGGDRRGQTWMATDVDRRGHPQTNAFARSLSSDSWAGRPLVAGGEVRTSLVSHDSPDLQTLVYLADGEADEVAELYSVPGGGQAVKLSAPERDARVPATRVPGLHACIEEGRISGHA